VAGELAQRVGDLLRGAADHDAGGLAAALRRQRPGRAEVSAVLLGMAGQEPLEPAAAKLLAAVQAPDLF
jgi:hypothetical protein